LCTEEYARLWVTTKPRAGNYKEGLQ